MRPGGRVDVAARHLPLDELVAAPAGVHARRVRGKRGLHVRKHRKRLVVDEHLLGGVLAAVGIGGEHGGHGLADEPDSFPGEQRLAGSLRFRIVLHGANAEAFHVAAGEEVRVGVRLRQEGCVDFGDFRVRQLRSHEPQVQRTRRREVLQVAGLARDHPGIFLAGDAGADVAGP